MPLFWLISFKAHSNGHIQSTARLPCFYLKVCLSKEIRFHRSPSVLCKPSSPDSRVGLPVDPVQWLRLPRYLPALCKQTFLPLSSRRAAVGTRFVDFVYLGLLQFSAKLSPWSLAQGCRLHPVYWLRIPRYPTVLCTPSFLESHVGLPVAQVYSISASSISSCILQAFLPRLSRVHSIRWLWVRLFSCALCESHSQDPRTGLVLWIWLPQSSFSTSRISLFVSSRTRSFVRQDDQLSDAATALFNSQIGSGRTHIYIAGP